MMIIPKLFRHPLLLLGLLLISSHAGVVLAKEVNSSQDNPGVAMAQTSGQEADTKDKNARSVDGSLLTERRMRLQTVNDIARSQQALQRASFPRR